MGEHECYMITSNITVYILTRAKTNSPNDRIQLKFARKYFVIRNIEILGLKVDAPDLVKENNKWDICMIFRPIRFYHITGQYIENEY